MVLGFPPLKELFPHMGHEDKMGARRVRSFVGIRGQVVFLGSELLIEFFIY